MPVAEPSLRAVQEIEKVRDELLNPRTVLSVLNNSKPVVVHPDARVGETLRRMYQEEFSQVPVYDEKRYFGLLTTNTVARWIADQLERHGGVVEDVAVRKVLSFAEKIENVLHCSRTLSVTETVRHFTSSVASGRPVTALILTNSGKRDETPLGIVLPADLARLP